MIDRLDRLARDTKARATAAVRLRTLDGEFRDSIRAAHLAGHSYADIAGVAGISRARVQQIVERRR